MSKWMAGIAAASEFTTDLVNVVHQHMLVFRQEDPMLGRATPLQLHEMFSKILEKIEHDDAYCTYRGPVDIMVRHHPPMTPAVSGEGFTHTFAADFLHMPSTPTG